MITCTTKILNEFRLLFHIPSSDDKKFFVMGDGRTRPHLGYRVVQDDDVSSLQTAWSSAGAERRHRPLAQYQPNRPASLGNIHIKMFFPHQVWIVVGLTLCRKAIAELMLKLKMALVGSVPTGPRTSWPGAARARALGRRRRHVKGIWLLSNVSISLIKDGVYWYVWPPT